MAITVSERSRETLSRLIRSEFDKVDFEMDYIYQKSDELINTAKEYGLTDLATELENDKRVELWN